MKAIILAGGQQSTISDERVGIPKPMAEIGGKPMLWHIMKYLSTFGISDFIICGGYKVDVIKEYFMNFYIYQSDICVNLRDKTVQILKERTEDWNVTVLDTGLHTTTAQRIAKGLEYVQGEEEVLISYGDVLSDIDVDAFCRSHREKNKSVTMAVAIPTGRNQILSIDTEGQLTGADELPEEDIAWANASMFMVRPQIWKYLQDDSELETQLNEKLVPAKQVNTYKHKGFWMPIETKRDYVKVQSMWAKGIAPWKKWSD